MISQVLFTSEQPAKNKMAFVGILSQIKLLFGPVVIQLVWYILKQLFTSVSVKVELTFNYFFRDLLRLLTFKKIGLKVDAFSLICQMFARGSCMISTLVL